MKFKNMKRVVALGLATMMAAAVVPASPVSAKTKYKTVKEDGKEYIVFGSYEQDGDESNGKEPIEWEVLGKDKNGILVVSRYVLDVKPYNNGGSTATWQNSSVRKWLNKDFYKTTFDSKEKKKIKKVNLNNADNKGYGIDGGKNTKDKVFCLSVDEISKWYEYSFYYDENNKDDAGYYNYGYCQDLLVLPTASTKSKDIAYHEIDEDNYKEYYEWRGYTEDCINHGGAYWWLRSPGMNSGEACYVVSTGFTGDCISTFEDCTWIGVRPAMYLKK